MRVRIQHKTRYHYPEPAAFGPHTVRLRPAAHSRARLLSYNLAVTPECRVRWQHDPWANQIAQLTFEAEQQHDVLGVTIDAAFDIRPVNPFDFSVDDRCEHLPFQYPDGLVEELQPFLVKKPVTKKLAAFIEETPLAGLTTDFIVELNRRAAERVRHIIRYEPGLQTSEQTLELGTGSCRDTAVLLVDVLRARGLAARFVSGYLIQLADDGILVDEAKGVDTDVVDLHAWAEVYIPGAGWIGLDGTSGLLCGEGHIPLASAVNPEAAAAITGTASVPSNRFEFEMDIVRIGHEARPRQPYTDGVWQGILDAGAVVDQLLLSNGLRLTSGAEPTWTSRTHPTEAEWNTETTGPLKHEQAIQLAKELRGRLGAGTLAMHGVGKQLRGECLPGQALHLIWRPDGKPVWRNPKLLDFSSVVREARDDDADGAAEKLRAKKWWPVVTGFVLDRLELEGQWVPGYEDPWQVTAALDNDLMENLDPLEPGLTHDEAHQRLARILKRPLGAPVGVALPIEWRDGRWRTSPWTFPGKHMFLVPGRSPMGLRLPLDQLAEKPSETGGGALCIEEREGCIHVFIPPLPKANAFLKLIAIVEDAAAELGRAIRIEGHPPPDDPKIASCHVTPGPGVIQVNLPASGSFEQYTSQLETVSDAANRANLRPDKYQLDGRAAGTGGGNHMTLGGPSAVESPFLKEPHLVASLLRCFQNHPSLSYLFTGLFVGPTSQATRIDEARMDSLDELELALSQVPKAGETTFPWTIDRLLRHLIVDASGNPHRTEVCIDRLYAPQDAAGRQGILKLRAFEMPPHERMAAVQMLLLRALVARFAAQPYEQPLVRWGTDLHDRFMLPWFLWRDITGVVAELKSVGLPADEEWFRPFLDFRFPIFGTFEADEVQIELRAALEPWPTLDWESGSVAARYVDSSLERIQIRTTGFIEGRHSLTVNGLHLPLHPTGVTGQAVAGVRFRAWQPPHCVQPNIGVHHPLRFDLIDTWADRSLGACTYHVWHPEGRAYDQPPLTEFEAAARRAQRFTTEGHAPWPARVMPTTAHPSHPCTLDLRHYAGGPTQSAKAMDKERSG